MADEHKYMLFHLVIRFFPFQFLAKHLIVKRYGVENYTNEKWGYTQTIHKAKPIFLIYYIPEFTFYPFSFLFK